MKQVLLVGLLAAAVTTGMSHVGSAAGLQAPPGETELGSVQIPRRALADGQELSAGTYQVRLTSQRATPEAVGQGPDSERWVEFLQGGEVKGREVASVVAQSDIPDVAESSAPGRGSSRVEMLKENEYLRVWINSEGIHYLIHLSVQS